MALTRSPKAITGVTHVTNCSLTSIAKFTPVTTIFLLLNKIGDGGSLKEPFQKAATLSILS